MEAKNLRIGNFVNHENDFYEILEINQEWLQLNNSQLNTELKEIEPISIDEQWLKNFGFTKVGSNYEKDWLLLHGNIKTGTIDFLLNEPQTGKYKATVLKYVHQLQNLFFAITGTELELKNKS